MNPVRRALRLYNIYRHYRAGAISLPYMPIRLWIDTCSACNLRCIMCPNKDLPPEGRGMMTLELFKTIADQLKGEVQDVNLHHRGEPLLNPAFFDMVAYAKACGLRARFHSNGTLMDAEKVERLLDVQPDLISFSIDGFDKEAYERVRVGGNFETTVANVMRLLNRRRERGLKHPYIVIERIHFEGRELPPVSQERADALKQAFLDAGADEVIEKAEYNWADGEARQDGAERSYSRCTFPWYAMVIAWDGVVSPCPQDFWYKIPLGRVPEQTLREIWNGEAYHALRRAYSEDIQSLDVCRTCDRLCRKTVGILPRQYAATFLVDQFAGYGRFRRWIGTAERNA